MRWRDALVRAVASTVAVTQSLAAFAQLPSPPDEPRTGGASDPKAEAVARFEKGLSLFDAGAWSAALAEFLEARRLHPLRNAAFNAALCLENLRRYDEAAEMLETLLRASGDQMPADARERAQRKLVELRAFVGSIEVEGSEPGAVISIDGQVRGEYPLLAPLRVPLGSHEVRVFKEGFEPFADRLDVPGGRSVRVAAPLRALVRSGRLRVVEQGGRALEVIVDGIVVGRTPWEGRLPVGEHALLLRGEGQLGAPPVPVLLELERTTRLTPRGLRAGRRRLRVSAGEHAPLLARARRRPARGRRAPRALGRDIAVEAHGRHGGRALVPYDDGIARWQLARGRREDRLVP
jgi:PEGA domain